MKQVSLPCIEGNATLFAHNLGEWERPLILTGKRRRADSLHWALIGNPRSGDFDRVPGSKFPVALSGLYRGRYADAVCEARELHRALIELGMAKTAGELARACRANGVELG